MVTLFSADTLPTLRDINTRHHVEMYGSHYNFFASHGNETLNLELFNQGH